MNLFFLFNFEEAGYICGFLFLTTLILAVAFMTQTKTKKKDDKERKKDLMEIAQKNGWEYLPQVEDIHLETFKEFRRFDPNGVARPTFQKLQNMLSMNVDGMDLKVFDYSYHFSFSKGRSTAFFTVAFYQAEDFTFPEFIMQREGISSKVDDLVNNEDIDFNAYPEFSKKFFLTGPDKDAVRNLFTSDVLNYLEKKKNTFSIEAVGDKIIFYHMAMTAFNQIDSKEIPDFVEDAATLLKNFRRSLKG